MAAVAGLAIAAIGWATWPTHLPMDTFVAPQSADHFAAVKMEIARLVPVRGVAGLRMSGAVPDASAFSLHCQGIPLLVMRRDGEGTVLQLARGALARHPPLMRVGDMMTSVFGPGAMDGARGPLPAPGPWERFVLRHRDGIDSGAACGA